MAIVFQGDMTYEIVGEYPAPDFFGIDLLTGVITITRDLRKDSLQLSSYQVTTSHLFINKTSVMFWLLIPL